jgi:ribosome-associated toxin RatA of RatAB toxin-antitoxin module
MTAHATTGGPRTARRFVSLLAVVMSAAALLEAGQSAPNVTIDRCETGYSVRATFDIAADSAIVHDVLTDYERIPTFMPQITRSRVIERGADRTTVEQEAVSQVMFVVKRFYLRLDIDDSGSAIAFTDRASKSFKRYTGVWLLHPHDGLTTVDYTLTAQPSTDAPGWLISRAMKTDAVRMIGQLREEAARRSK